MNKKLLALLNQINAQKQKVVDLANDGKLEEAKAAKEELQKMQDKFDLLKTFWIRNRQRSRLNRQLSQPIRVQSRPDCAR